MEQNLNIAKILKGAPGGTKFWSSLYGECELDRITEPPYCNIVVVVQDSLKTFNNAGYPYWTGNSDRMCIGKECMLFPSKDNRDWSTFKAPWQRKHFEPFQKVLVLTRELNDGPQYYNADFYSHWDKSSELHYTVGGLRLEDSEILDYEGNEDKLGKKVSDEV